MEGTADDHDEMENRRPLCRLDSLDVEANHIPDGMRHSTKVLSKALILKLAFESIGVIYGDLGTSPLYVYSSTFPNGPPSNDDVLGALCLIIYTLSLIPLLKYIVFVLQANDNGNGGTFALYSLICRHAKVSRFQNEQVEDQSLCGYRLQRSDRAPRMGAKIKEALEGSPFAKKVLLLLTLLGTCAVMGDGVLTPAISVLSAVDGIQTKVHSLTEDHVVLISVAVLVILFSLQRSGTEKVAFLFAPCVIIWFAFIGGIGIFNIFKYDASIFRAFNPYYIINYFQRNGRQGWISLGGIVLAITGTEAMFADLGHFSVPSVQIAFASLAYPSLLAAYIGQEAHDVENLSVIGIFRSTTYIGNAYGMAVLAVMLVTTTLVTLIMVMIWRTKLYLAIAFFTIFGAIEVIYFSANLYKFPEGGWLPVAFSSVLVIMMAAWHYVTSKKYMFESDNKISISSLERRLESDLMLNRVPGIGLMYTQLVQGVPPIVDLFIENLRALHSVIVFVSVKHLPVSTVPKDERFLVRRVGNRDYRMYRSVVRYGYMDPAIPHGEFEECLMESLKRFVRLESYELEMLDRGMYIEKAEENKEHSSNVRRSSHSTEDKKRSSGSIQEQQSNISERKEEVRNELEFLSTAREEGITYLLGSSVIEVAPSSSIGKRFVVNVVYNLLQRISRKSRVALQIPHKRLMEVGITYTL
ncbi:hypothetical protein GOP47_0012357 [Adiantum capillus-veneris]|uniref:Potassium transporter n=1 Tax=Adiantum capillus-veneris TaxID=13818 RepID=A0A9D4ZGS5_ADICA|nr:hypothetical protein GOP47_0012357 [Adiantum capillus-veneris]